MDTFSHHLRAIKTIEALCYPEQVDEPAAVTNYFEICPTCGDFLHADHSCED